MKVSAAEHVWCLRRSKLIGACTFRQSIAHVQHRHQIVDVTIDTLSHAGVLQGKKV